MNGEINAFIVKTFYWIKKWQNTAKSIKSACRTNCMQDNIAISPPNNLLEKF
jgi:hypothetical protein